MPRRGAKRARTKEGDGDSSPHEVEFDCPSSDESGKEEEPGKEEIESESSSASEHGDSDGELPSGDDDSESDASEASSNSTEEREKITEEMECDKCGKVFPAGQLLWLPCAAVFCRACTPSLVRISGKKKSVSVKCSDCGEVFPAVDVDCKLLREVVAKKKAAK